MSIGTTITAPFPAPTASPQARRSPLNPSSRPQSSICRLPASPQARRSPLNPSSRPQSSICRLPASSTNTRTHLSNLDLLLLKQHPSHLTRDTPAEEEHQREADDSNHPSASTRPAKVNRRNDGGGGGRDGNGLFNALNLNTIIPSLRNPATEAMSPKSLTQLQRLLDSPRTSPKNSIASRWRLFHGSADWANLIDPLDENLRRELVRYGDLVQAAYHAFHSNPAANPSRKRHVILPDRSYRVTKSLYATSSVDLPKWLHGLAPWMTQRSSWIGYVAVCDNAPEITRMGRRDIVISLRGTSTCMEWAENLRVGLVPMTNSEDKDDRGGGDQEPKAKAAKGFYSLYKTRGQHVDSLSETVVAEVRRLIEQYKGEELSITVTGHSLGAALALFVADDIRARVPNAPPAAVFSFGGPRVGNKAFADQLNKNGVKVLRVVNANDVITRVPGVLPREELGRRLPERWGSHVLDGMDGYVHVGSELRVDSKSSPYLRPDADPACCHDLESYLHLVDGFMGSDCPFRADANRSLVQLLDQQRPNVKRLYVSQAKALGLERFEPAALASPSHVTGCLASPSA